MRGAGSRGLDGVGTLPVPCYTAVFVDGWPLLGAVARRG